VAELFIQNFYTKHDANKEMVEFEILLTTHSTLALPSQREGREFLRITFPQGRDNLPGNFPSFHWKEGVRGEWEKGENCANTL